MIDSIIADFLRKKHPEYFTIDEIGGCPELAYHFNLSMEELTSKILKDKSEESSKIIDSINRLVIRKKIRTKYRVVSSLEPAQINEYQYSY